MKSHRIWLALILGVTLACPLRAAQTATVTGNRVNVRGKATLNSEVITQLMEGDKVTILEEVKAASSQADEPSRWAKIRLPADTSVFVFAPYIGVGNQSVKVDRLNLRGGPGENFSVLGQITRGTQVQEIQTTASWMEISPPDTAFAFVSMDFLKPLFETPVTADRATTPGSDGNGETTEQDSGVETETAAGATAETDEGAETDAEPPVVVETVPDTAPVVTEPVEVGTEVGVTEPAPVVVQPTITMVPVEEDVDDTPRRVVIREGRVVLAFSVQAPTKYALMSLETRRYINFLHTEKEGLKLEAFSGRDVFVVGEELLDERWAITPILEVEDVQLAP